MLLNLGQMSLRPALGSNQQVFSLSEQMFLLDDTSPKLGEQITDLLVLVLIELRNRCEMVLLVLAKHFALTAGRSPTVRTEVVQSDPMLSTSLGLLATFQ